MNLQATISTELWNSISSVYEGGNFSHAVLEAIHHVTNVIRDRSGIDGDGAALVGQSLGGETPKLRVNALQTESERSVQKGIEQLLRGVYLSIRNPRSHEQFKDTQQDADAIIHFLDYVLRVLEASKEAFTLEAFMQSVVDPEFVESLRYAELIVAEIPTNRRGEAMEALYAARLTFDPKKVRFLVSDLLAVLDEEQMSHYLSVVSEELKIVTDGAGIRTSLQMLTPDLWSRISEAPRLRTETRLLKEIERGEILLNGKVVGALGTWSNSFLRNFSLRVEGTKLLLAKLEDTDRDKRHYVAKFFMFRLPEICLEEGDIRRAIRAIASAIREGDSNLRDALITHVRQFPEMWQTQFIVALEDVTDPSNPAVILDDGRPLLGAPTADAVSDDDIPF